MIYVFPRDLSQRRMLFAVTSLSWTEKYSGIGTFSLVAEDTEENAAILRKGNIVHYNGYDGVVSQVVISSGTITANGYGLAYLLNHRAPYNNATLTNVEADCYTLYSANRRGLDVEIAESKGYTETCEVSVDGGAIGDWISEACSQSGLGFRVTLDVSTGKKVLEIYKGEDHTDGMKADAVTFSTATNTLSGLEINDDDSEFANVAVVRGVDLDEQYVLQIVGDASGPDRREIFVDASSERMQSESKEYDDEGNEIGTIPAETLEEYQARLRALGAEELQARLDRTSFTVTVQASSYGKRYKLGDLVSCYSPKHGLLLSARVSEVKHTLDRNSESIEVTLGEPKLRLKEMVNIWLR